VRVVKELGWQLITAEIIFWAKWLTGEPTDQVVEIKLSHIRGNQLLEMMDQVGISPRSDSHHGKDHEVESSESG